MAHSLVDHASAVLLGAGLVLWFWGTWPLLGTHSYLRKLHALSVADTLGSLLMLLGLLLRIPGQWPLLTLALLGLVVWNTIFGYVLAACSLPPPPQPATEQDSAP
ncbi:monovalent cation/H(+) antiporter subunit G [Synechococcus sp. ATX 2A4]|uniref:monovalent cation/H(+) antiporter subunit G n=1 Tax=Synechococcus sp. ATX 2A4 TaxID=2823727 RepID=UPI0020CF0931|nr:monovalent cation/H(+) antiporter subunit G [Synechococcus sp. ATX 2A4]MCP9883539.1 monovalent cation/H(+) antiporter subunit G [Synechococcus sp. ATX 2A4]